MPNWVTSITTITGSQDDLDRLRELVGKTYKTYSQDWKSNEVREIESVGVFQLWNIASPTDLASYYGFTSDEAHASKQEQLKAVENNEMPPEEFISKLQEALSNVPPLSPDLIAQFQHEVETKDDWYHWNLRNWGTKWDIDGAEMKVDENKLIYTYTTAWSPPMEALNKLAVMFPLVTISSRFLDENDCFAGEALWQNGGLEFEHDIRIDHALKVEMYGSCWACDDMAGDPDYDGLREEYRCADYNKLVVPNDLAGLS